MTTFHFGSLLQNPPPFSFSFSFLSPTKATSSNLLNYHEGRRLTAVKWPVTISLTQTWRPEIKKSKKIIIIICTFFQEFPLQTHHTETKRRTENENINFPKWTLAKIICHEMNEKRRTHLQMLPNTILNLCIINDTHIIQARIWEW